MDGKIDTVREAIEGLLRAANRNVGGMAPGVIASWCHKALAALSTIDPEAIRREARAEALGDAVKAIGMMNQMAATAMNDDYLIGYGFGVRDCQIRLESILSAEPAQDDGKEEAKE